MAALGIIFIANNQQITIHRQQYSIIIKLKIQIWEEIFPNPILSRNK